MSTKTVRVAATSRGTWEIALSGECDRVTCGTLEEARRVAYLCAAHQHPCELVVLDAYHRVLEDELIDVDERDVANAHHAIQASGAVRARFPAASD